MRLDSQRESIRKLDSSKKFEIIQAMIRQLDITSSGTTVTPKQINDSYFLLSKDKKDKFWSNISQITETPRDTIEKYYFFEFQKQAYTGNISVLKYDITKKVSECVVTPETNIITTMQQIYSSLLPQVRKFDIHPGSVQQTIYQKLQALKCNTTPKKSSCLRSVTVYTTQTPTSKQKDDPVLEKRPDQPDDDLQQMINALTEIVNQYQH